MGVRGRAGLLLALTLVALPVLSVRCMPAGARPSAASPTTALAEPTPTAGIAVTFIPVDPTNTCIEVKTAPSRPDDRFGGRGHVITLRGLSGQSPYGTAGTGTTFLLPLPEGDWEMTVQVREGYAPAVTRFSLDPATCAKYEVVLEAVAEWRLAPATPDPGWGLLEGEVTDNGGQALPGQEVVWNPMSSEIADGSGTTFTDADGRYRFHLRPADYHISILPRGAYRRPEPAVIQVVEGEVANQDFRLERE